MLNCLDSLLSNCIKEQRPELHPGNKYNLTRVIVVKYSDELSALESHGGINRKQCFCFALNFH